MNRIVSTSAALLQQAAPFLQSLDSTQDEYLIFPGLCDVHVHFREPGFSYKETIRTGSMAAARGGYTTVCTMPNLNPVPDCRANLDRQRAIIRRDAVVETVPYGAITRGRKGTALADMAAMADAVCAFSDDGSGVQDEAMMRAAMLEAKRLGKLIAAHCEDNSLLHGGCIHDGAYARVHGYRGISSESEYAQIARDLRLAQQTGAAYHVCHISTKESVALIRQAKAAGVNVSCETAPHYLVMTDRDLHEHGNWKMNPPVRSAADRDALLEGVCDGTIDCIATDHAPHSAAEKSRGLADSPFGIVGLETAFPLLYTELVQPGVLSLERLVQLMSAAPRTRFGLSERPDDFTVFEITQPYEIQPSQFLSKGKNTPFAGRTVYGKCILTVCRSQVVYDARRAE